MKDVLKLKTVKHPKVIIDDTIDGGILFSEKLEEANEMLEKYPIEAWFALHQHPKTELEKAAELMAR
jgi:hypothetical protein